VKSVRVAILGDFDAAYVSHPQTGASVLAAAKRAGARAEYDWVPTTQIANAGPSLLDGYDGVWMAPGSPYRSLEGALSGIAHVRASGKPYVGT
jgi:CTP synthase (UTP-ammonia lyase)